MQFNHARSAGGGFLAQPLFYFGKGLGGDLVEKLDLLTDIEFSRAGASIKPMLTDDHNRIIRFALGPGQEIKEHRAPNRLYIVVLQGNGMFTDGQGQAWEVGPGSFLSYEPGEKHSVRAGHHEFVFIGILKQ